MIDQYFLFSLTALSVFAVSYVLTQTTGPFLIFDIFRDWLGASIDKPDEPDAPDMEAPVMPPSEAEIGVRDSYQIQTQIYNDLWNKYDDAYADYETDFNAWRAHQSTPKGFLLGLMDCPFCLGVWVAIIGALVHTPITLTLVSLKQFLVTWLALTGVNILLSSIALLGECDE